MNAVTTQNPTSRNESRHRFKTGVRTHDTRNWAKRLGPASRAPGEARAHGIRSREIRVGRAMEEGRFQVARPTKQNHSGRSPATGCHAIATTEGGIRAMESAAIGSPRRIELGRISALSGWVLQFNCLAAQNTSRLAQAFDCQFLIGSRGNRKSGGEERNGCDSASPTTLYCAHHQTCPDLGSPSQPGHLSRSRAKYGRIRGTIMGVETQCQTTAPGILRVAVSVAGTLHTFASQHDFGRCHQDDPWRTAPNVARVGSGANVLIVPAIYSPIAREQRLGRHDQQGQSLDSAPGLGAISNGALLHGKLTNQSEEAI